MADILLVRSLEQFQKSDFEGCIQSGRKAIEIRPNFADAFNNICAAYNSLGKFDEALKAGQEAIRLRPNFPLAQGNVEWAKRKLKK
ncbi:MAG: hypothetical protein WA705_13790 [Candidatus Ozemobacteraceae bacterium]